MPLERQFLFAIVLIKNFKSITKESRKQEKGAKIWSLHEHAHWQLNIVLGPFIRSVINAGIVLHVQCVICPKKGRGRVCEHMHERATVFMIY